MQTHSLHQASTGKTHHFLLLFLSMLVTRVRLPRDNLQGEQQWEEWKERKTLEISHSFYKLPQPGLPHAQNRKTTDL